MEEIWAFKGKLREIKAISVTFLQTPIPAAYRDICFFLRNENIYKWEILCCKYLFLEHRKGSSSYLYKEKLTRSAFVQRRSAGNFSLF